MVDIDYIMELIDWNSSADKQEYGIELAQSVECINVFLQPSGKKYNKNVWGNCAVILSKRSNDELSPYITELMIWLQDMNWPGAFTILDRLVIMKDDPLFERSYSICLKCAKALDDSVWENNLRMIEHK